MAVRLIAYDLNKPRQNHAKVLKKIKTYNWAMLSESSYAVQTNEVPSTIVNKFEPLLDDDDSFLVLTLIQPYQGQADKGVVDWLQAAL